MSNLSTIDSYIQSLLNTSEESIETLLDDIKQIAQQISEDHFIKDVLYNSVVPSRIKMEIWKTMSNFIAPKPILCAFISTMISNTKLHLLDQLIEVMQRRVDEINGIVRVSVTVPVKLDVKTKNSLSKTLDNIFKSKVLPEFTIDESIVGGLVITTDKQTLDLSFRSKIEFLKKAFGVI